MKHSFIDKFAHQQTPVHRLDGRVKAVVLLALVVAAATTPIGIWWAFVGYGLLLCSFLLAGRIPAGYVLGRWLMALPFIMLVIVFVPFMRGGELIWSAHVSWLQLSIYKHGLVVAATVFARATVSVIALVTLTSITTFPDLLESLERLKIPPVLTRLASFGYRYLFVLVDEAQRLTRARDCRSFGGGIVWHAKVVGQMIANLFLRSYTRADRVYLAMLSRGYDGQCMTDRKQGKRLSSWDLAFLCAGVGIIVALRSSALWL